MISTSKIIAVQPLGDMDDLLLRTVADDLQTNYRLQTEIFPRQDLPRDAYDPQRRQYNCYPMLKRLNELKPQEAVKIIGLTDVDLFIPILTYVFGEAEMGGKATIVSVWRLMRGSGGEPLPAEQVLSRAAKIAVHELAHTFRLPHCREEGCIMGTFPSLANIDETQTLFCRYCLVFLKDEYERLGLLWRDDAGNK